MPLVVDTDTGIDDALALLWLAGRREVELVAVFATHGNCATGQAAANARRVLDIAGRWDVPVTPGRSGPLVGPPRPSRHVHGRDGLGDCGVAPPPWPAPRPGHDAVAGLLRLAEIHAGELDLLVLGPLTTLAATLVVDPHLPGALRSLTIMGGVGVRGGPGVPPARLPTDANTAHDPDAARRVHATTGAGEGRGPSVTLIGLDVTLAATAGPRHLARLAAAGTSHGRFAATIVRPYLDEIEARRGTRRLTMHDPIAAMVGVGADVGATFVDGDATVEGAPGNERTVVHETRARDASGVTAPATAPTDGRADGPRRSSPSTGGRTRALVGIDADAVAEELIDALTRPLPFPA